MASVIIPAHDEVGSIERLLLALAPLASDTEVIVVCNGCTDATARIARRAAPWARVIELGVASKPSALDAGDAAGKTFPRAYIDADVDIDAAAVSALFAAVTEALPAVAATPVYDLSKSSLIVRSHYAIWSRMEVNNKGLAGTNAMAVSQQGRCRFRSWPRLIGDDYFLDGQFDHFEKCRIPGAIVMRTAPRGLRDCVSRKARAYQGNVDVLSNGLRARHCGGGLSGALRVVRDQPTLAIHMPGASVGDIDDAPACSLASAARHRTELVSGQQPTDIYT